MKYVILAAGSGTRLWPFSRQDVPKQFLSFDGEGTLLQKTVKRFISHARAEDFLIVTHQSYYHLVKSQLHEIDPALEKQILLEPERRGTAPAICLALKHLVENGHEQECVLICSSDHLMDVDESFFSTLQEAQGYASQGHHVLFGVKPSCPETGYGYIKVGSPLFSEGWQVEKFVEKPNKEKAEEYLASGNYFWNAGIFLFHIPTFAEDLEKAAPAFSSLFKGSFQELHAQFSDLPSLSIDYALLEHSDKALVVPLACSWSDLGCWDSVYELFAKDSQGNAKKGNVVALDSKNCLMIGNKRLIATVGVEDLFIVETEDAVFVGKKGESQRVKDLVNLLQKQAVRESKENLTSHRPWGTFTVLEEGSRYKIKRIVVNPGQRLSLQLHYHRSEHWVVVKGTAKVTVDDKEKLLHENESVYIEKSQVHRLENPGKVPLEMIEVQVGEYVGEDDIVRLADIYARV